MLISANGLVFNEYGDTLLVRRDDTRTLAPPGGAVEIGELPPLAVEREVYEETGLKVTAVRLVGLHYLPTRPHDYLFLSFRAIQRGGTIQPSAETPRAGFFKSYPLPEPMLALHREQIESGISHPGGSPAWGTHEVSRSLRLGNELLNRLIYPLLDWRRRVNAQPAYIPAPSWQVVATTLVRNERGEILWRRSQGEYSWQLPMAVARPLEPPWSAAARALRESGLDLCQLSGLSGIYLARSDPSMTFTFLAGANGRFKEPSALHYFAPGREPDQAHPAHIAQVGASCDGSSEVHFALE